MAEISETAKDAVRQGFNPSKNEDVATLKLRTAELVTIMEAIGERHEGLARSEAMTAIEKLRTASMWCVLAATKGL